MSSYDYKKEAQDLILPQFDDSPILRGMVDALLEPTVEWQQAVDDLIGSYNLDNAEGVILDDIGKLLNVKRLARNDDAYRAAIKVRIVINTATGTGENLIKMLRLVLGQDFRFRITEQFPATVVVTLYEPQDIIDQDVIDAIIPIGVGSIFLSNPADGKVIWIPSDIDMVSGLPTNIPEAILPDLADLESSNMTLIDIYYVG